MKITLRPNKAKANTEYADAAFDQKKLVKFVFESEEPLSFEVARDKKVYVKKVKYLNLM